MTSRYREKHLLTAFKEQEYQPNRPNHLLSGPLKLGCLELCWDELAKAEAEAFWACVLLSLIVENKLVDHLYSPLSWNSRDSTRFFAGATKAVQLRRHCLTSGGYFVHTISVCLSLTKNELRRVYQTQ